MIVLVTGACGFIGKHVCARLKRRGHQVYPFDVNDSEETFSDYLNQADFIIHLAGVNRPTNAEDYYEGNYGFTKKMVDMLLNLKKSTPILMSSSIQASLDNDYGKSKRMAEDYLLQSGLPCYIYRLSNVFGKWCRPNYNSVIATFSYNIAHGLPIEISDPSHVVDFQYVDDIAEEFAHVVETQTPSHREGNHCYVDKKYPCTLGRLVSLLTYFKTEVESDRHLPKIHNEFELKLFKTFCAYLSEDGFSFNFAEDERGYFEELYKSKRWGQISDNVAHPGIIKGGHYHTYKREIFYTVIGESIITQRNIETNEIIQDAVSGNRPRLVDILINHTHQIQNIGQEDTHTLMWISEPYDEKTADTYRAEVIL